MTLAPRPVRLLALACLTSSSCVTDPPDDPSAWTVDTTIEYAVRASEPRFVIPAGPIPARSDPFPSNNNVEIVLHGGRLFLAWRTSETHFASPNSRIEVISSKDDGATWDYEASFGLGADVREPRFLSLGGRLWLLFFEAGVEITSFSPKLMYRSERGADGRWGEAETWGDPEVVPWDLKLRGGRAWLTSYVGNHYAAGAGTIEVRFEVSDDGLAWKPVQDGRRVVYTGGVSEVAFEFDEAGALWAVGRNEDGDASGFGANVCTAPADALGTWTCSNPADPERYDSPEMFRHGDDLYLVARRDIGGPFDQRRTTGTFEDNKLAYLLDYSLRPKTTALYRIDRDAKAVKHVMDLPGAGDTAFPSVVRTGPHSWLLANYTSPLDQPDITWFAGQESARGTQIYLLELTFEPAP